MRIGWLAAAAAMVCAVPANAARYYEFEISGLADTEAYDYQNAPKALTYNSTTRFAFDTQGPNYGTAGNALYIVPTDGFQVEIRVTAGTMSISTMLLPAGPAFNFSMTTPTIASDNLSYVPLSNYAFKYSIQPDCRYGYTYPTLPGFIYNAVGRTTDTAPVLGLTRRLTVTVVPEPASWAMMLIGVAAIGVIARRRVRVTYA